MKFTSFLVQNLDPVIPFPTFTLLRDILCKGDMTDPTVYW